MKKSLFLNFQIISAIFIMGFTLYKYIDHTNQMTELQLAIPKIEKEIKELKKNNIELEYQILSFENPAHLLNLANDPRFAHLKPLSEKDVHLLYPYEEIQK